MLIKVITVRDVITLGNLLKFANVIASGGEVKSFLLSHQVSVNGEAEARRGRKLYQGDEVVIDQKMTLQIIYGDN